MQTRCLAKDNLASLPSHSASADPSFPATTDGRGATTTTATTTTTPHPRGLRELVDVFSSLLFCLFLSVIVVLLCPFHSRRLVFDFGTWTSGSGPLPGAVSQEAIQDEDPFLDFGLRPSGKIWGEKLVLRRSRYFC